MEVCGVGMEIKENIGGYNRYRVDIKIKLEKEEVGMPKFWEAMTYKKITVYINGKKYENQSANYFYESDDNYYYFNIFVFVDRDDAIEFFVDGIKEVKIDVSKT